VLALQCPSPGALRDGEAAPLQTTISEDSDMEEGEDYDADPPLDEVAVAFEKVGACGRGQQRRARA
jgi:hypothetical protein